MSDLREYTGAGEYGPFDHPVDGYCPACGSEALYLSFGIPTCFQKGCPDPTIIGNLLDDSEIHHIVRFDPNSETFNVKHPLRERVNSELLDCEIHGVIQAQVSDGQIYSDKQWHPVQGTWRLKYEPTWTEDPEFGGDPFSWEKA